MTVPRNWKLKWKFKSSYYYWYAFMADAVYWYLEANLEGEMFENIDKLEQCFKIMYKCK